jgi:hypothetical protein
MENGPKTGKAFIVRTGHEYGKAFSDRIAQNMTYLVRREGLDLGAPEFLQWVKTQEGLLAKAFPWMLEEMARVADGAGLKYKISCY